VAFCDNLLTDYLEDNIGKLGISAINLQWKPLPNLHTGNFRG
jgi:hypothetical protein